jgi:hypothetical protein
MSVIVALISKRDGVVASDGRLFGPARFDNDRLTDRATIESDSFDKTFALAGGKIIGAFSGGVMRFSGNTVFEHISEIATPLLDRHEFTLEGLAAELEDRISDRLANIDEREVIFRYRNLAVLLVGGASVTRSNMRIISIQFVPNEKTITCKKKVLFPDRRKIHYTEGDNRAAKAAHRFLANSRAPNEDPTFLKKLTTDAVRIGIKASGMHLHASESACGGHIFTQRTHY